jgi:peptide/nickel transport system substrate-binding protein
LDGITVKIIPSEQTRVQSLIAGDSQATVAGAGVVNGVKGNNSIKIIGGVDTGGEAVVPQMQHKPGNDIRFRRAIALAFDPNVVNQVITKGAWTDLQLTCPPFTRTSAECLPGVWPKADVTTAKQLIQQYLTDGGSKTITLLNIQGNTDAEFIQQQLDAIGLDVKISTFPAAQYLQKLNGGDFEIAWSAMTSFSSPYPKLFQYFHSTGRNLPKQNLPDLDKALEAARNGLTADQRNTAYKQVQQIMDTQYIYAWFSPYINGLAVRSTLNVGTQAPGTNYHMAEFSLTGA